jgi:hypothetical protein
MPGGQRRCPRGIAAYRAAIDILNRSPQWLRIWLPVPTYDREWFRNLKPGSKQPGYLWIEPNLTLNEYLVQSQHATRRSSDAWLGVVRWQPAGAGLVIPDHIRPHSSKHHGRYVRQSPDHAPRCPTCDARLPCEIDACNDHLVLPDVLLCAPRRDRAAETATDSIVAEGASPGWNRSTHRHVCHASTRRLAPLG